MTTPVSPPVSPTWRDRSMTVLRRVSVNGVELNVALAGKGPAVLLLHGF
ncbi:alpha/beta hydrolase, partial [Streptomyces sp. NPDC052015]